MPTENGMIENLKDAIHYRLDLDLRAKQDFLITEAVYRLLCDVQEFVFENIYFLASNSEALAKKNIKKKYIIVLSCTLEFSP